MTPFLIAIALAVSTPQVAEKPATEMSDYFYGQSRGKILVYRRTAGDKQTTLRIKAHPVYRFRRILYSRRRPGRISRIVPPKRGFALRIFHKRPWPIGFANRNWIGSWQGYEVRSSGIWQNTYYGWRLKPVLVLPSRIRLNTSWDNSLEYNRLKAEVTHKVLAVNKTVSVPAGKFSCLVVQDQIAFRGGETLTVTRSYGKGIGLIKEVVDGKRGTALELLEIQSPSKK